MEGPTFLIPTKYSMHVDLRRTEMLRSYPNNMMQLAITLVFNTIFSCRVIIQLREWIDFLLKIMLKLTLEIRISDVYIKFSS